MTLKRYDLITNYRCGDAIEEMEPREDGEWVRYDDVEAIIEEHAEMLRELTGQKDARRGGGLTTGAP